MRGEDHALRDAPGGRGRIARGAARGFNGARLTRGAARAPRHEGFQLPAVRGRRGHDEICLWYPRRVSGAARDGCTACDCVVGRMWDVRMRTG